jgi:tetratricopeptide (TPR) repeat protein
MGSAFLSSVADRQANGGNSVLAEKLYTIAERVDPQNWAANFGLGRIFSGNRYYELDPAQKTDWASRELEEFRKAYRDNPRKEEIVYGLGRAEQVSGNPERAMELFRLAARYKPFNDFYWRKLGIELRKAGQYDEALSAFEHAQKLDRSNKTVKRNIQWIKARMNP